MNPLMRGLVVLAGCVVLCASGARAEEKTPEAFPLQDIEADVPRYVRIIEEFGTGDLEAGLDLIEAELPTPFSKTREPFEIDPRAKWQQGFKPLADLNARFESVEFLGYRPLSSAARTLYFMGHSFGGPVQFRLRVFRYQDKWKVTNFAYESSWDKIEAHTNFTRFEKPITYDLDPQPLAQTDE